jgi:hypothetical protein
MVVSRRREGSISRAASRRTASRRAEREPAGPENESKWRQMYSARMAVSVKPGPSQLLACMVPDAPCPVAPSVSSLPAGLPTCSLACLPVQLPDWLQESMRRVEETTTRQNSQSGGPSFVEAQDKAFAQQASAAPQLSASRSCEAPASLPCWYWVLLERLCCCCCG